MNTLYFTNKQGIVLICLILLCSVLFLFLHPAASVLFGFASPRDEVLTFVDNAVSDGSIDAQGFWKAREFAAPGSFEYMRDVLVEEATGEAFLTFESPIFHSEEYLIPAGSMTELPSPENTCSQLLFESNSERICQLEDGSFHIAFVKSIDEMLTANAFLDVRGRDGNLVEGKEWYVVSRIF